MDKKLIPGDLSDTPVTAQILAATISSVQNTLVAKDVTVGGQGIRTIINDSTGTDEDADVEIEEISQEDTANLQAKALKIWKYTHADSAVTPSEEQITTLRKRNKRLYEQDAKKKTCSRRNCDKPKACFTQRESLAKKRTTLYIFVKCKAATGKEDTKTGANKKKKKIRKKTPQPTQLLPRLSAPKRQQTTP